MICLSDKIELNTKKNRKAFTLMEVVVAVMIVGVIVTSVITVMNRCIGATIDSRTNMQAFEIARNNMEKLLAENKLAEKIESGISELNPDIQWQSLIETFIEPVTGSMWLQAVCSATYTDHNGELQAVELKHWLSEVSPALQKKLRDQEEKERDLMEQYAEEMGLDPGDVEIGDDGEIKPKDTLEEQKQEPEPYVGPPGPGNWPPDWTLQDIIKWYKDHGYLN